MKIGTKIGVSLASLMIGYLLVSVVAFGVATRSVEERSQDYVRSLSQLYGEIIENVMFEKAVALRALYEELEVVLESSAGHQRFRSVMNEYDKGRYEKLGVYDSRGELFALSHRGQAATMASNMLGDSIRGKILASARNAYSIIGAADNRKTYYVVYSPEYGSDAVRKRVNLFAEYGYSTLYDALEEAIYAEKFQSNVRPIVGLFVDGNMVWSPSPELADVRQLRSDVGVAIQNIGGVKYYVSKVGIPQSDYQVLTIIPWKPLMSGMWIIYVIGCGSVLLSLVAFYLTRRYWNIQIAKPLRFLLSNTSKIRTGKKWSKYPFKGGSEISVLASAMEKMVDDLGEYHLQAAQAAGLVAIGRISSHIAHDMRSPLSVLKTYAGLKSASDDPDVEDLRQSAERSVVKLEHMAEDLVDYAKASKLERKQQQLSAIIYEGSIAQAKKKAEEKGVKISCAMQGGILVNVDSYKIERVMINLINNAVQAIENGDGEVSIAATTEHNGVLKITVRDNGKGIDPDSLPHIFDSFFTKGKKGGSGLGLAYCKQVVEAHGGTIDVASDVGKGTTFTIKIPNCAVEHQGQTATARDSSTPLGMTGEARDSSAAVGMTARSDGMTGESVGMTIVDKQILIADDDPDIRRQWERIIPEHGGTIVHTAKTVKEVEEATLDYTKIDTAIVDYQFYGEDKTGIDLIKYLKAKGVKTVYLCTGFYDNEVIINQAHAAGVDRILPKPIDPSSFIA